MGKMQQDSIPQLDRLEDIYGAGALRELDSLQSLLIDMLKAMRGQCRPKVPRRPARTLRGAACQVRGTVWRATGLHCALARYAIPAWQLIYSDLAIWLHSVRGQVYQRQAS